MMKMFVSALPLALILVSPASAQNQDLGTPMGEGQDVESIAVEGDDANGPLRGTVSDDSALDDLGIAIPAFATDRNVPTPANANGTEALGVELARLLQLRQI